MSKRLHKGVQFVKALTVILTIHLRKAPRLVRFFESLFITQYKCFMKNGLVIVNGIKLPYFLTDHAIAWAKKEGGRLKALFLSSGKEMPEGYTWPSDIDLAETVADISDTEKSSIKIIRDEMNLFRNMLKGENIEGDVEYMVDPTLEQVLEKAKTASIMFMAPGYGETAQLAITDFSLQDLADRSPCPVQAITDHKKP
jgi:hypothetical protein